MVVDFFYCECVKFCLINSENTSLRDSELPVGSVGKGAVADRLGRGWLPCATNFPSMT